MMHSSDVRRKPGIDGGEEPRAARPEVSRRRGKPESRAARLETKGSLGETGVEGRKAGDEREPGQPGTTAARPEGSGKSIGRSRKADVASTVEDRSGQPWRESAFGGSRAGLPGRRASKTGSPARACS